MSVLQNTSNSGMIFINVSKDRLIKGILFLENVFLCGKRGGAEPTSSYYLSRNINKLNGSVVRLRLHRFKKLVYHS